MEKEGRMRKKQLIKKKGSMGGKDKKIERKGGRQKGREGRKKRKEQ